MKNPSARVESELQERRGGAFNLAQGHEAGVRKFSWIPELYSQIKAEM